MTCDSGIHEKVGEPFRTFMRQNNGPGSQQNFRTQLHAPVFWSKKFVILYNSKVMNSKMSEVLDITSKILRCQNINVVKLGNSKF